MRLLKFCFSTLMLISLISFSSCGGDEMCLVTVTSGEGGTATVSESEVMAGDEVTLTATHLQIIKLLAGKSAKGIEN